MRILGVQATRNGFLKPAAYQILDYEKFQIGTFSVPNCPSVATDHFNPQRLESLRKEKGLERQELALLVGCSLSQVTKHENGQAESIQVIVKCATALDCELDYLYERGTTYANVTDAAVRMSFGFFSRDLRCTDVHRERGARLLNHPSAPRTAQGWRELMDLVDTALGPEQPSSPAWFHPKKA